MKFLFGWRSLRKLMYFIKDIVFYIFIFALGFLIGSGIIKVKALDSIVNYDLSYSSFDSLNYEFNNSGTVIGNIENEMNELENALSSNNINYIIIVNLSGSYSSNYFSSINVYEFDTNTIDFELSRSYYDNHDSLVFSTNSNFKVITLDAFDVKNLVNTTSAFDEIIDYINTNKHIPNSSEVNFWKNYTYLKFATGIDYSYNLARSHIFYSSNIEMNLKKFSNNLSGLRIDDEVLTVNSKLKTYSDIYKNQKITYTENFTTDTKNIDRIEYTFDFTSEMNEASHFVHEFNFSTTFMSDDTSKLELFNYPYLNYTKFDSRLFEHSYKLPLNEHKDLSDNQVVYYDTQLNPFTDIQSLKFVVDFDNINELDDSSVFIHFDSNLNFTRKIIYLTDEDSRTKIYNVNNIDHIEVDFDLTNIPNSALVPNNEEYFKFKMNFDIKTVTNQSATTLSDTTLDIPQIQYILDKEDNTQSISKYTLAEKRKVQYNKYYDNDSYTNTYFVNYEYNRSLKLIINCRDINDVYLYLFLRSNLEYEITVFYRDDVEDYQQYYSTIDLTGKYAVLFMPKLRQNGDQTAVSSYFISNGKFQVEERDTYIDDYTLYKDPTTVDGTNQYYYFYTPYLSVHYNDSFYYKNLNYPSNDIATIRYDTRYFVVSVCKNEFECETITNPNTNEVISPKPPHEKDEWSFSKLIERVKKFVDDLHSTMDPIANSIQQFYNNLPSLLQNFLLVIYIVFLLFALIKVMRR